MIEQHAPRSVTGEASLVIRPNRALSSRQLTAAFAVVATASLTVSTLSWVYGNVFAPFFALLELSLLAACLRLVWRAGERFEVVAIGPSEISVRRLPEMHDMLREHPFWVSLSEREGRVLLVSRGREVEVGACLGEAERQSLVTRLRDMMGAAASSRTAEPAGAP